MLAKLIGNVDQYSAMVLVALSVSICIIITTMIAKRRSRLDVTNEFELAKMKEQTERADKVYRAETERQFKIKQLDQNLITSHKSVDN